MKISPEACLLLDYMLESDRGRMGYLIFTARDMLPRPVKQCKVETFKAAAYLAWDWPRLYRGRQGKSTFLRVTTPEGFTLARVTQFQRAGEAFEEDTLLQRWVCYRARELSRFHFRSDDTHEDWVVTKAFNLSKKTSEGGEVYPREALEAYFSTVLEPLSATLLVHELESIFDSHAPETLDRLNWRTRRRWHKRNSDVKP